jgi:hypothetical protein
MMLGFFVGHLSVKKEVRNGYKYNFNLSYIFIKKNHIFLYNFRQKWLDTLHYLLPIQIALFSRLSLPS